MRVEVCHALPHGATRITVVLEPGATVADAVSRSGIVASGGIEPAGFAFAIFGRRVASRTPLRDGDRVELLRPLKVDPMEARRLRARKRSAAGGAA